MSNNITEVIHHPDDTMEIVLETGKKFSSRPGMSILDLLVEVLMTTPDVEEVSWKDLLDRGYKGKIISNREYMPMVKLGVDTEANVIAVSVTDGDNGDVVVGLGETVIRAVMQIMRSEKYTPGMPGYSSPTEFMQAIAYGRERRSNELLQAELEQVFAPEKGAW